MTLFNTLDRYIARHLLLGVSLTLLVLSGLGFIGLFMGHINDVGVLDYGYDTLFKYVLLNLPAQIYEILPAAALIGTSTGLSMLALSSELTAMRAAGVSLYRIFFSVFKFCLLLVLLAIMLGEWIAPAGLDEADRVQAGALHQPLRDRVGNVWLREGDTFVRIGDVLPDGSLRRIYIVAASSNGELVETSAKRGVYRGGKWHLQEVRQTTIKGAQIRTTRAAEQDWSAGFGPDLMETMQVPQKKMSTLDLLRYVAHLKANGQNPAVYELSLWKKLVLPVSTLIMVMLAVPFVFGSIRSGGLGKRVFIGVLIGFSFSVLQSGMGYYSLSFGVSPAVAALTPSVVFLFLTVFLFYRAVRVS